MKRLAIEFVICVAAVAVCSGAVFGAGAIARYIRGEQIPSVHLPSREQQVKRLGDLEAQYFRVHGRERDSVATEYLEIAAHLGEGTLPVRLQEFAHDLQQGRIP